MLPLIKSLPTRKAIPLSLSRVYSVRSVPDSRMNEIPFGSFPETDQGPAVGNPIHPNPRLKINRGFISLVKNIFKS